MNDLDVKLSEEVASQAGKEINNLKKTIQDDVNLQNEILRDYTDDARIANKFIKKICVILVVLLFLSIGGLVGLSIYNQHLINKSNQEHNEELINLISGSGFETTVEMLTDNESTNNGNLSFNK